MSEKVDVVDIKQAVCLIPSDAAAAAFDIKTYNLLLEKHSRTPANHHAFPESNADILVISSSVPGVSDVRPQYLKDSISGVSGTNKNSMVKTFSDFTNFIMSGNVSSNEWC